MNRRDSIFFMYNETFKPQTYRLPITPFPLAPGNETLERLMKEFNEEVQRACGMTKEMAVEAVPGVHVMPGMFVKAKLPWDTTGTLRSGWKWLEVDTVFPDKCIKGFFEDADDKLSYVIKPGFYAAGTMEEWAERKRSQTYHAGDYVMARNSGDGNNWQPFMICVVHGKDCMTGYFLSNTRYSAVMKNRNVRHMTKEEYDKLGRK